MSSLALFVRTVSSLGMRNVARVALYKLWLKAGWRPRPLSYDCPREAFFAMPDVDPVGFNDDRLVTLSLFGWHPVSLASPPDWHADPFEGGTRINPDQDWVHALAAVGDGDVKKYWELSRFYWLPQFALAARSGDSVAAARIEHWLQDWVSCNPAFRGINWACGQEAAIRLINLAMSALILDSWRNPSPAMKWLVETHARRIQPTLSYAVGQDNNHGTAEACALFIAGTWGQLWAMPHASRIARTGRKWINDRALRMIQPDGSPCQYSTNYHRANLEGFCMAGLWSARTGVECLNADAAARVADGARWLFTITDPTNGDAPNLGANDGSHLFSVPQMPYRDFRPTVALAAALFTDSKPYGDARDERLEALGLPLGSATWPPAASRDCDHGGFHILRLSDTIALMRYPRFRFRPSQADILHVDVWHKGINLLRDAGTYSYKQERGEWFAGTSAHNTITFDQRNQMRRLGPFLFGGWLKADVVETVSDHGASIRAAASYTDSYGARHHRAIILSDSALICEDTISGNFEEACLRWRLTPGEWHIEGVIVRNGTYSIAIDFNGIPISPTLSKTVESRYYLQKTEIPEISVKVCCPGKLVTTVNF